MKIEELKKALAEVTESRRPYGNIRHKLTDIIILGLCTVICGGEDFNDKVNAVAVLFSFHIAHRLDVPAFFGYNNTVTAK